MSEHEESWTEAERKAMAALPKQRDPGPEVEDRIVEALRARGLVRARRRPGAWLPFAAAAAGLLLALGGYAVGRASSTPAEPSAPRFVLLLLRGEERLPDDASHEAGRVAEYREWARGLARGGRYVSGEKLEDRGERLVSASGPAGEAVPTSEELRGFFIISAASFEDALSVARRCPHLRYGGAILVRPIA